MFRDEILSFSYMFLLTVLLLQIDTNRPIGDRFTPMQFRFYLSTDLNKINGGNQRQGRNHTVRES